LTEIPQHLNDLLIISKSTSSHAFFTQVATSAYEGRLYFLVLVS
jgi:hypothetical protein